MMTILSKNKLKPVSNKTQYKGRRQIMDIVSRINERLPHLRPTERKIAQFILNNINLSATSTINELADKINVSHASITRLSKTLECENVRDLKIQLAKSAAVGERFTNVSQLPKKDIPEIYQAIHKVLAFNAGLITNEIIDQASCAITAAKHTLIFGVGGGSTFMAQECQNRFFRLGVKCNAYSDPMLMRMTSATVDPNDVVVCLSLSGQSPDVLTSAEIAKGYGAKIVAICPEGPLSSIADYHLPISADETDYIFKPSASRYVMLAAIDILSSELAVKNQRKSREKLRRLKLNLDAHRGGSDRLPLGD
jgi:RpiR family carbohydrate utilization transcriptional regulator